MSVALFIAAGAAVALTAVYVLATRATSETALAGDNTVIGLNDAASETLVGGGGGVSSRADWQLQTVAGLSHAEDLLDSLEARGHADRELIVLGNSSFAVRWR